MKPTTISPIATAHAMAVLPAEDLARARHFYHDTLGFDIQDMPEEHQFLIVAGDDTRVLVYERARTVAEHTAAAFTVADLHAVVQDLRSRGVQFEEYDLPGLKTVDGIAEGAWGQSAWFIDPEGNIISLSHAK
ncbi:MAG: VOC family protein [Coriobacteriia bacterium]|nr:VOC family protein [Coriobacteriia bacterium]